MKRDNDQQQLEQHISDLVIRYFNQLGDDYQKTSSALYGELMSRVEKQLISEVLNKTQYNQCQTACLLGISRTTLRKKMSIYQLFDKEL